MSFLFFHQLFIRTSTYITIRSHIPSPLYRHAAAGAGIAKSTLCNRSARIDLRMTPYVFDVFYSVDSYLRADSCR